ncbi:MAG: CDP-archaeol synthase [Steroidobacteraceae bacterium]|jgi:hypothetical protein|nr:CDP-archaeol synthase [Steroidobacteraceae bacterium]
MRGPALALALLIAANAGAWAAGRLLGQRWAAPLDGRRVWRDGRRLLGDHKTWRGLAAGVGACTIVGAGFGLGWRLAAAFGLLSLLGDACSSALKRRLDSPPGTEYPALDQLPEALLPLCVLARPLGLDAGDVLAVAATFLVLDVATSRFRRRG